MGRAQSRDAEGRKFVLWRGRAGASSEREAVETARRNAGRRQPESMGDRRRHRLSRRLALFTVFVRGDQWAPGRVAIAPGQILPRLFHAVVDAAWRHRRLRGLALERRVGAITY